MAGFNYDDYQLYIMGGKQYYKVPGTPKDADASFEATKQYKNALFDAARGRIAQYDSGETKDGKMSYDEFYAEQLAIYRKGSGDPNASYNEDEQKTLREDFGNLDINSDGFLGDDELANELSLIDRLDKRKDGVLLKKAWDVLYGQPADSIKTALRSNYQTQFGPIPKPKTESK